MPAPGQFQPSFRAAAELDSAVAFHFLEASNARRNNPAKSPFLLKLLKDIGLDTPMFNLYYACANSVEHTGGRETCSILPLIPPCFSWETF
jgi:hypothetical protein